jgi:hypothetical protein
MSAIEIVKDGTPRLGIAFLIGKAADGGRDHAVYHSLIVVGVCPPGPRPIPGHSRRIVRPGNSAGNDSAWNTYWRMLAIEQGGMQAGGSCNRQGELSARHFHFDLTLLLQ